MSPSKLKSVIQKMYVSAGSPFLTKTVSMMASDMAGHVLAKVEDMVFHPTRHKNLEVVHKNVGGDLCLTEEDVMFIFRNDVLAPLNVTETDITELITYEHIDGGGLENEFADFTSALVSDFNEKNVGYTLVIDMEED